jgi:hypothetical protein
MQAQPIVLDFDTPPEDYPLGERIVLRDSIALFESQPSVDFDITQDTEFLAKLPKAVCYYGPRNSKIHPFICVPKSPYRALPYASAVLRDLRAEKNFKSEHIKNLDIISITYPGYNPGTENDEIHTETSEQSIFQRADDKDEDGNANRLHKSLIWHSKLQSYVLNSHIYYVLLHTKRHISEDGYSFSIIVILFAIGVSPLTGNLVGAVTHQVCHNYCD